MKQATYTLTELSRITSTDPRTVYKWVKAGWLEPAERGRRGAGHEHRFSKAQVERVNRAKRLIVSGERMPAYALFLMYDDPAEVLR